MMHSRHSIRLAADVLLLALFASGSASAQMNWRDLVTGPLGELVYDAARQRVVSFGAGAVREWDGATWSEVVAASPSPGQWIYHDGLGVPLLIPFGQFQTARAWNGIAWTTVSLGSGPTGNGFVTYDATRNEIVVFGGATGNETWTWQGSWIQHAPTNPPSPRPSAAMVFDRARSQTILFGGPTTNSPFDRNTYGWDGAQWSIVGTNGPDRGGHRMAHDARLGGVVFSSGFDASGPIDTDLWSFTGTTWQSLGMIQPRRHGAALVFDGARNELLLWGGIARDYLGTGTYPGVPELWAFDAAGFRRVLVASPWPGRPDFALATDTVRNRVVLTGGPAGGLIPGGYGDVWEWDGSRWSGGGNIGIGAASTAIAYDDARQQMVGLAGDSPSGWTGFLRNGATWVAMPASLPPFRVGCSMAYDRERQVVVLFGGLGAASMLADTWEWNGSLWTQRFPAAAPSPRRATRMAFDAPLRRVLLFGGSNGLSDTWLFDGSNWQQAATNGPAPTTGLAYDPRRERTVLSTATTMWEWIAGAWVPRSVTGGGALAFDLVQRGMLSVGGQAQGPFRVYEPVFPASAEPFGSGCSGSAGVTTLDASRLPWLGATFALAVSGVPTNQPALLMLGYSRTTWGPLPLPLPLAPIGMPGCSLLVSIDTSLLGAPAAGTATWTIGVPNLAALLGTDLHGQAAVGSSGTNPFGWVASNGIAARIGAR